MRAAIGTACLAAFVLHIASGAVDDSGADGTEDSGKLADDEIDDIDLDADLDSGLHEPDMRSDGWPGAGSFEPGGPADGGQVVDFDASMPEDTRRQRMTVCFALTQSRAQSNAEALEATIQEMATRHKLAPNEAANAIVVNWMMSCYMNIDDLQVADAIAGSLPSMQDDTALFSDVRDDRPQKAHQASPRQWKLLQDVLMTLREASGYKDDTRERPPAEGFSAFSSQTQALYFLAVFGIIFGILILGVTRLVWSEKAVRERSGKSLKKAEKAEKKLAKKRL